MQDGSTRVLRMSHALEQHLQQEWTPYLLANAADIRPDEVLRALVYQDNRSIPLTSLLEKALGDSTTALLGERAAPDLLRLTPRTVSGAEMLQAVCTPVGCSGKCAGAGGAVCPCWSWCGPQAGALRRPMPRRSCALPQSRSP